MNYTATKIRRDYLEKLKALSGREQRSMMKELEYLIDKRAAEVSQEQRPNNQETIPGD